MCVNVRMHVCACEYVCACVCADVWRAGGGEEEMQVSRVAAYQVEVCLVCKLSISLSFPRQDQVRAMLWSPLPPPRDSLWVVFQ